MRRLESRRFSRRSKQTLADPAIEGGSGCQTKGLISRLSDDHATSPTSGAQKAIEDTACLMLKAEHFKEGSARQHVEVMQYLQVAVVPEMWLRACPSRITRYVIG